jgi:branched-chain amino acid transport system substrate-binding protein
MKTAHELGITATIYLVGSCASPTIGDQIGQEAVEGRIFTIEGPNGADDPESAIYFDAVAKYGDPQLSAATAAPVSFRGIMNLYAALVELGPDHISRQSLIEHLWATKDHRSFTGHPYTCDGQQIPDLPALCAPQQILVQRQGDTIVPISDWIDVPDLVKPG